MFNILWQHKRWIETKGVFEDVQSEGSNKWWEEGGAFEQADEWFVACYSVRRSSIFRRETCKHWQRRGQEIGQEFYQLVSNPQHELQQDGLL